MNNRDILKNIGLAFYPTASWDEYDALVFPGNREACGAELEDYIHDDHETGAVSGELVLLVYYENGNRARFVVRNGKVNLLEAHVEQSHV